MVPHDNPETASAATLIAALAGELRASCHGDARAIAAALQWTPGPVRTLLRGGLSARWRLLFSSTRLALVLGRTREAVAAEMATAFVPSACVIGRALAQAISGRGADLPAVLKQLALSEAGLIRLLLGRALTGLSEATRAGLAGFLDLTPERIHELLQESLARRRMPTKELELLGPACALAEVLHEAFAREGINQTEWVSRHHFSNHWIRSLVIGRQPRTPPRSLARLAAVLGLEERQVLAGLRLNQPFPPPPHPALFAAIARNNDGAGFAELARAFAMTRPGVERLCARQDLARTSTRTLHRIRRWLGLDWRGFVALAGAPLRTPSSELRSATSFTPVDHGELVMIRLWRRATPSARAQALHRLAGEAVRLGRVAEDGSGAAEVGGGRAYLEAGQERPRPLCELLFEALERAGETPTGWGIRHHLSLAPARGLLLGERMALGSAIVAKLADALALSVPAARAAMDENRPLPAPPHPVFFAELARRSAGLERQELACELKIARSSYDRMLDLGDLRRVSGLTIHRVRRWLGWSWAELVRQAGPDAEAGRGWEVVSLATLPANERDDEEELTLIRSWRRAGAPAQEQALTALSRTAI